MASAQEELYSLQARYEALQRSIDDVDGLRRQVAELEAENARLRELLVKSVENTAA